MGRVSFDESFFENERFNAYARWMRAFWRENVQNSVDARARRIDISLETVGDVDDKLVRVVFADDGVGMTRDVLENVYFALGRSTKDGSDASNVGGFGRARILTCFGMQSYAIRTLDNVVEGRGGDYTIETVAERHPGCRLDIVVNRVFLPELRDELEDYLRLCQPSGCQIVVQGEPWKAWCNKGGHVRDLVQDDQTFARVYVNKSGAHTGQVIVRIHGSAMFTKETKAAAQVVVELEPSLSRKVLTSNRDGMMWRYERVLDTFLEELAVNTTSAIKPRFASKDDRFEGLGFMLASPSVTVGSHARSAQALQVGPAGFVAERVVHLDGQSQAGVRDQGGESAGSGVVAGMPWTGDARAAGAAPLDLSLQLRTGASAGEAPPQDEAPRPIAEDIPSVQLVIDSENPLIHRAAWRYHPKNWIYAPTRGGGFVRQGADIYKLMRIWRIALEEALHGYFVLRPQASAFQWGLGWVLSDDTEGLFKSVEQARVFLLNPVDDKGRVRFRLSSRASIKRIMAVAKHEVAHLERNWHDETYASFLTDLDAQYDEARVFSRIRREISA